MTAEHTLIHAENLSRYYGSRCALDNISFKTCRGEILGFLGPNGAGKSTTMQIISGILAPSTGQVSIAGYDIQTSAQKAKQHIGFLSERPPLYIDLTVDEYLLYSAKLRGITKNKLAAAVALAKTRCGLDESGGRLIQNLSKGYQQRVGIAQAIIHSPDVIILDEPTSGLDPIQIYEIRNLMRQLGENHSVILSTHLLHEVQQLCDRVLIIHQGQIVLDQSLKSLQHKDDMPSSIEITLKQPPALDTLNNIKGVKMTEDLGHGLFRLNFQDEQNPTDQVLIQAGQSGWGLSQLHSDDSSLESLFIRLTQESANITSTTKS